MTVQDKIPLKIKFISEKVSNKIKNQIKRCRLPIRPIFTPGDKLRSSFVRSRPWDTRKRHLNNPDNCKMCPSFTDNSTCAKKDIVYQVTCKVDKCDKTYTGEACWTSHDRLSEHCRAANNPSSYKESAIGQHYANEHPDMKSQLEFEILDQQSNTQKRIISEAIFISKNKPQLNNKQEQRTLKNVLTCMFYRLAIAVLSV